MNKLFVLGCLVLVFPFGACVDLSRPQVGPGCTLGADCKNQDAGLDTSTELDAEGSEDVPQLHPDSLDEGIPMAEPAPEPAPVAEPSLAGPEPVAEPPVSPGTEPSLVEPQPDASTPDASTSNDADPLITPANCPVVLVHTQGKTINYPGRGAYCVVTCDDLTTPYFGWDCFNLGTRTLKVNGQTVACKTKPLPAPINGHTVFEIGAGSNTSSALTWWGAESKPDCTVPDGGSLP